MRQAGAGTREQTCSWGGACSHNAPETDHDMRNSCACVSKMGPGVGRGRLGRGPDCIGRGPESTGRLQIYNEFSVTTNFGRVTTNFGHVTTNFASVTTNPPLGGGVTTNCAH